MTKTKTSCMLEACTRTHYSRGLCLRHHKIHTADGTLEEVALPRKNTTNPWHRLIDRDEVAGIATCSVCGPDTPINYRKASDTWRCSTKAEQYLGNLKTITAETGSTRVYRYGPDKVAIPRKEAVEARAMLEAEQGGLCAICGDPSEETLHLDHCHDTGVFRGLLCRNHNVGLGFFQDNIEMLRRAADYLERVSL